MKTRRWMRGFVLLCMLSLLVVVGVLPTSAAEPERAVVSYGLGVLSALTDVAVAAPVGNDALFSAELFARGLNLSRIESLTLRQLPDAADGALLLGSTRVAQGQTLAAADLDHLVFSAARVEPLAAKFGFSVNGDATVLFCSVYMIEGINYTPTVSMASSLSLDRMTYSGMTVQGSLSAYDPDGDELIFEVVSYPKNGALRLEGGGRYAYTPFGSFVGEDGFSYVARDRYGNYSAKASVRIDVTLPGSDLCYTDMQGSSAELAAYALGEAGVMSGTPLGTQHYFYPEKTVSRLDFLVMAMHAAGIEDLPTCYDTGFADDADIPESLKGYVATAYAMKYISGSLAGGELRFLPNEMITKAEAAVILSGILKLSDAPVTPTFADGSEIPVWASDAIYSLNAAGILTPQNGYISANEPLTREQTALMLWEMMRYCRG